MKVFVLDWRKTLHHGLAHAGGKPAVWLACSAPLVWLLTAAFLDRLGANPAEALIWQTGEWTLRLLCLLLALTPLRVQFSLPQLARYRRMVGLWVFTYASLHVSAYAWLDMGLDPAELLQDLGKRPFILVGFLAWCILALLAATSPRAVVRWLGGVAWQRLHRLVYAAAGLSVLHFFWKRAGKNQFTEVAVYAVILALLLGWRIWRRRR